VSVLNVEIVEDVTQRRSTELEELDDDVDRPYVAVDGRLRRSGVEAECRQTPGD